MKFAMKTMWPRARRTRRARNTLPGGRLLASRYLLEKRLGRGAMGQVYLARDQNLLTRRVAVKTVRPDILNDEDLQEGEAIAVSNAKHVRPPRFVTRMS